jgi:hypothetical protein
MAATFLVLSLLILIYLLSEIDEVWALLGVVE